jgi:hypothetical protein
VKIYQVRFAEEALADLARIFTDLVSIAGEQLARVLWGGFKGPALSLQPSPGAAVSAPGYGQGCGSPAAADTGCEGRGGGMIQCSAPAIRQMATLVFAT